MYDIDEIELRRLDMTVLLVFINLMRFRKASDVADHMGLTQSSISHSLKRLREAFGDPLFIRNPKGMEPTAIAWSLQPKVVAAVASLSEALRKPASFDPQTTTRVVRIGAYDHEIASLIPEFLARMRNSAPGLRLSILPMGRDRAVQALERAEIDIAIGFFWQQFARLDKHDLYEESYCGVMRADHPLGSSLSEMTEYLRAEHLLVSPIGELHGVVDRMLAEQGHHRKVVASVPQFLASLPILRATDLVATLPKGFAERYADSFGLQLFQPPLAVRPFAISALVHQRDRNNPMLRWVRGQLCADTSDVFH